VDAVFTVSVEDPFPGAATDVTDSAAVVPVPVVFAASETDELNPYFGVVATVTVADFPAMTLIRPDEDKTSVGAGTTTAAYATDVFPPPEAVSLT
jgi:hypothetical protein